MGGFFALWTVAGVGLVAGGVSPDGEVLGFEPFVVAAADGDQVVDVGRATVFMPFLYVVEIASVHGGAALEAASVSRSHREALGSVGQPLVAAHPERTARPVEDHAGQFGVCERVLRICLGTGPTPTISTGPSGSVPSTTPNDAVNEPGKACVTAETFVAGV